MVIAFQGVSLFFLLMLISLRRSNNCFLTSVFHKSMWSLNKANLCSQAKCILQKHLPPWSLSSLFNKDACSPSATWTERVHEEAQHGLASERPSWCFELDEKYVYFILLCSGKGAAKKFCTFAKRYTTQQDGRVDKGW